MTTNFVTFDIGNRQSVHRQVNFAAISILAQAAGDDRPGIFIVTDQPQYYRWIRQHVRIVEIDAPTLTAWRAPHGYFWRIKIRAIQHVARLAPGNLVYLDGDVACNAGLADFCAALDAGKAFMHRLEYELGSRGGSGRELRLQAVGRTFGRFPVTAQSRMWNAGIAALPAERAESWLADALECLDALCAAGVESAFLEQFSLSQSLDRDRQLQAAEPWFIHYWGNKESWNARVACFLADVQLRQLSIDEACESFRALPSDLPANNPRSRAERIRRSLRKRLGGRLASREAITMAEMLRELAR